MPLALGDRRCSGARTNLPAVCLLAAGLAVGPSCGEPGGGDEGICEAGRLAGALEEAQPGDTVTLGACEITGAFTVRQGVTLQGAGRDRSTLVVGGGGTGIELVAGTEPTSVVDLRVESDGPGAIVASDGGAVNIERVDVHATRGYGIGARDLASMTLSDVTITGPIDSSEAAAAVPSDATIDDTLAYGLLVLRVQSVQLSNVTVSGAAFFGAYLADSSTTWTGGGVPRNLGVGLLVTGGSAALDSLDLSETFQGFRLPPALGAAFVDGAAVESSRLESTEGEGIALFHDTATAHHQDLQAQDNGLAAVWVQASSSFELTGGELLGNGLAGVIAARSSGLTLRGTRIDSTRAITRIDGITGGQGVGDGVQLVETTEAVLLEDLTLSNNERVGILIDTEEGTLDDVSLAGITVDSAGESLGVIAQANTVPEGWDSGVTRQGATLANDAAFGERLGVVSVFGPMDLPPLEELEAALIR